MFNIILEYLNTVLYELLDTWSPQALYVMYIFVLLVYLFILVYCFIVLIFSLFLYFDCRLINLFKKHEGLNLINNFFLSNINITILMRYM